MALQESYRTSTPAWWTEFSFSLSKHEDIEGHRWVNVGGHCWEMAIIGLSSCNHVKQSTKVPFVTLSNQFCSSRVWRILYRHVGGCINH